MKKLPFKSYLMKLLLEHPEGLSPQQLCDLATPLYGSETQCCVREIDEMMMGMLSVGFGDVADMKEDEDGNFILYYILAADMRDTVAKKIAGMERPAGNARKR